YHWRPARSCRHLRATHLLVRQVVLAELRILLESDFKFVSQCHGAPYDTCETGPHAVPNSTRTRSVTGVTTAGIRLRSSRVCARGAGAIRAQAPCARQGELRLPSGR